MYGVRQGSSFLVFPPQWLSNWPSTIYGKDHSCPLLSSVVVYHMPIYAGLFLGSLFFIVLFVYPSIQSFFKLSW